MFMTDHFHLNETHWYRGTDWHQTSHLHLSGSNSQSKNKPPRTAEATVIPKACEIKLMKTLLRDTLTKRLLSSTFKAKYPTVPRNLKGCGKTMRNQPAHPLLCACLNTQDHRILQQISAVCRRTPTLKERTTLQPGEDLTEVLAV